MTTPKPTPREALSHLCWALTHGENADEDVRVLSAALGLLEALDRDAVPHSRYNAVLDEQAAEAVRLQTERETALTALDALCADNAALQSQLDSLGAQLAGAASTVRRLRIERDALDKRCDHLEHDRRRVEDKMSKYKNERDTLRAEVAALKAKMEEVRTLAEELRGRAADLRVERDALAAWSCTSCGARFTKAVPAASLEGVITCSSCAERDALRVALEERGVAVGLLRSCRTLLDSMGCAQTSIPSGVIALDNERRALRAERDALKAKMEEAERNLVKLRAHIEHRFKTDAERLAAAQSRATALAARVEALRQLAVGQGPQHLYQGDCPYADDFEARDPDCPACQILSSTPAADLQAHDDRIRRETLGTQGVAAIAAERKRQVEVEGWTPEHDDDHDRGELAEAAGCYAIASCDPQGIPTSTADLSASWPWAEEWWKPTTPRRMLVKAGALIAAEIDRLDRAAGIKETK